jgi:hypothetical protein
MKGHYPKLRTLVVLLAAMLCMLAAASEERTFAQSNSRSIPTSIERREDQLNRQSKEYERDSLNAELNGRLDKPRDQKRNKVVAAEIQHDFEGLQSGYNRIVLTMASKKDSNDDAVLTAVAEIGKFSARLKDNLALPRPDDKEKKEFLIEIASEKMEPLLMLRRYVYSFVTNPLFESKGALDVRQAKKAGQDLQMIIELSESIRKESDKLKKAH